MRHSYAIAFLVILFLITRAFLFTGFPFTMNFLDMGMQILDPVDLEGNLFNALMYQHIEPPLFNALIGLVLKITTDRAAAHMVFSILYGAMGLSLVLGIYLLSLYLGASQRWSLAVAALYVFWPPNILEQFFHHPPPEKWLSYDYPIMVFILAMVLALACYRSHRRPIWLVAFLLFSAATVLTRSFFHLIFWFVPTMIFVLYSVRKEDLKVRRVVLAVSLGTLLIASAPSLKNFILFDYFGVSTFQGMNIASRTLFLPKESLEGEVAQGTVTPLALIPRFSVPEVYRSYYREENITGNGLLDRLYKSTGHPNWNHFIMIRTSREYRNNTFTLLRAYPLELVKTTVNGIYIFFGFEPHQFLWPLEMPPWGFWDVSFPAVDIHGVSGFLRYIMAPLFFAGIFSLVLLCLLRRRDDPVALLMAFALVYVFVVANLGELGHNGILRKQVDPLLFAGAALWITQAIGSGNFVNLKAVHEPSCKEDGEKEMDEIMCGEG